MNLLLRNLFLQPLDLPPLVLLHVRNCRPVLLSVHLHFLHQRCSQQKPDFLYQESFVPLLFQMQFRNLDLKLDHPSQPVDHLLPLTQKSLEKKSCISCISCLMEVNNLVRKHLRPHWQYRRFSQPPGPPPPRPRGSSPAAAPLVADLSRCWPRYSPGTAGPATPP